MGKKGRQAALALLLTVLLYGMIPMLSALLAVKEWADAEELLTPMLLAAMLSSAAGSVFLLRRGKWSVFVAALLTGLSPQLIALLVGRVCFGTAAIDGQRWLLAVCGFAAALLAGLFFGQRKGAKRHARKRRGAGAW